MDANSPFSCVFTVLFAVFGTSCCAKQVAMKVVDEPSSYGMNFGGGYQDQSHTNTESLKMRIPPSNFSGPPHLKRLMNKCYTKNDESYKYEFCAFSNITQYEQSLRWNPYSGVLGVWQEWEIVNNTFVAMIMSEGDSCGATHRSVRIVLKCGEETAIGPVTEPNTCHYKIIFHTPLVCHRHSLLVYPTLSEQLRKEWDIIETRLANDEITQKGYRKLLRKVFEKAGYQVEASKKAQIIKEAEAKTKDQSKVEKGEFNSLSQCSQEYVKLRDEVARLKSQMANNNAGGNIDNKRHEEEQDMFDHMHGENFDAYEDYKHLMADSMEL